MQQTVLFFDLDGTVMVNPFGAVVFPTVREMLVEKTGLSPDALRAQVIAESQRRQANPPPGNYPSVWDWDDIIQTVARANGLSNGAIPANLCETLTIQHAGPPYTATLDDAVSILQALRKAGHRRLVVASMGLSKYQIPVMRGLGLYDCFDDFLMPDLTGYLKTDSRYYQKYLALPAISIGDNYIHDVVVPKSLGFRSVLRLPVAELERYRPFERPAHLAAHGAHVQHYPDDAALATTLPDAIVTTLAELPEVVDKLETQR